MFKPVIIHNFLHSITLLSDACSSFTDHCVVDTKVNEVQVKKYVQDSLMLVTCLNPHIGYDNAAKAAKKAYTENKTLKEACVELGLLTGEQFDQYVRAEKMLGPES